MSNPAVRMWIDAHLTAGLMFMIAGVIVTIAHIPTIPDFSFSTDNIIVAMNQLFWWMIDWTGPILMAVGISQMMIYQYLTHATWSHEI